MDDVQDIRQLVWSGTLPIKITLARNENRKSEEIEYLFKAHRLSYLPLYLSDILKYFRPYLNSPETASEYSWWFEFEGVPVKWNWPIGLSYDLLIGNGTVDGTEKQKNLPWRLILHYKKYPNDYLLALSDLGTLHDYWLNQNKQSCFIRDGKASAIMNLSKEDSVNLWKNVEAHNFAGFWKIANKLIPSSPASLKHIPIKAYLPVSNKTIDSLVSPFIEETDNIQTLGNVLHDWLPELFPSKRTCIVSRPILHGAAVPLTSEIASLWYSAMYNDGFLHISIVMMS